MQKKLLLLFIVQFLIILEDCNAYPSEDVNNIVSRNSRSTDTSKGSFLWEIGTKPPSYLFGTVHVPYTTVWDDIPQNAKDAFHHAAKIYFELDFTDKKTLTTITACQYFSNGNDLLPSDLYNMVENHLELVRREVAQRVYKSYFSSHNAIQAFSTTTASWAQKRPIWVYLMISFSLTETYLTNAGVPFLDLYLIQQAKEQGKQVGAVELAEEQCQALNAINSTLVDAALRQFLDDQIERRSGVAKPQQYGLEEIIRDYRESNSDSLLFNSFPTNISSSEELLKELSQVMNENLISKRNGKMAARVMEQIKSNPETSLFFAFGAFHFLGEKSVVELLRSQGLEVRRVPANVPFKVPFHLPISMSSFGLRIKLDILTAILCLFLFLCIRK
jgi:uncharacterized protein YbaP (TraB family)